MKPRDRRVICIQEGGILEVPGEPGMWFVSRRLEEGKAFAPSGKNPLGDGLYICLLEVRPATLRERIWWARQPKPWHDSWHRRQRLADGGPRFVKPAW